MMSFVLDLHGYLDDDDVLCTRSTGYLDDNDVLCTRSTWLFG
jgi:hypothetical protein